MIKRSFLIFVIIVCVVEKCLSIKVGSCVHHIAEKCTQQNIRYFLFNSYSDFNESISIDPNHIKLPDWIDFTKTNKLIVHGYGGNLEFFATKIIRNGKSAFN